MNNNNNNFNNGLSSRGNNTSNGNIVDNNQLNQVSNQNNNDNIVFDKNMNSNLMSADSQFNQGDNQALNNNNLNNTYSQQQTNHNIYPQFVGDNNSNMNSGSTNIKSKKSKIIIIGIIALIIIVLGVIIVLNISHNTKDNNKLPNNNNNKTSQTTKSENYSICAKEGNKCSQKDISDGQLVNVSVNNKTNYDFYVIDDDGENLTLLKRGSLGDIVAWCSRDDKYDAFLAEENADDNIYGPYTALKYLNELTNDWTNIEVINNYNFENPNTWGDKAYLGLNIQEGVITLISNSSTTQIVPGQARARLLTESEFKYITGTQDGEYVENVEWLDRILNEEYNSINSDDKYDDEKVGHEYFWLMDAHSSGQAASTIMRYKNSPVHDINVWSKLMLYPVITVTKSQIN